MGDIIEGTIHRPVFGFGAQRPSPSVTVPGQVEGTRDTLPRTELRQPNCSSYQTSDPLGNSKTVDTAVNVFIPDHAYAGCTQANVSLAFVFEDQANEFALRYGVLPVEGTACTGYQGSGV